MLRLLVFDSGTTPGPIPNTFTTYDAVGIREDLEPRTGRRSISRRAVQTMEQQVDDLLRDL